jgi:hypothetical protein
MLIKRTRGAIPAGLFFSALALVASIESAAAPAAVASELREVEVRAEALDLPASGRLGRSVVEIKAAFALHGEDPYFGGLSGLWLAPDGSRLVALTDRNHLFQARLVHDDQDRLVDLVDWTAVGIARAPGDPRGTVAKDSEALAASADGEHLVVAYEGFHRLREIPLARPGAMPRRLPLPQGLGGPSNSGIETLALLGDGSLMAIAERVGARGGGLAGWLIKGSRIQGFAYEPADGFSPTGADALDGVVYLLERRFSLLGGFESRLLALPEDEIRAGSRIEGRELAAFRWGDIGENFEAIAARRTADGRALLYLLADDNFAFFQRSLLLQLALPLQTADREHPLPAAAIPDGETDPVLPDRPAN